MYVTKRDNKYRAWKRIVVNGEVKRISVTMDKNTAQSRKTASEALRQREIELTRKISDISYSELVEAYIAYQKATLKTSTVVRNEASLKRLIGTFGDSRLEDMNAGFIQSRLFKKTSKPGTYNEYLKRLKAMFRWAYRYDYIDNSACVDKIKPLKDVPNWEKVSDKYLEADELKLILDAAPPFYSAVFGFLALSGLRIGELIALNDEDVTENDIIVKATYDYNNDIINTPKTQAGWRYVHIQPELAKYVKKLRKCSNIHRMISRSRAPYFVINHQGGRLSYHCANNQFKKLCARFTVKKLTLHALRHTHVALMAESGATLEQIARRCGHSSPKITQEIYYHVTKKQKDKDDKTFDQITVLN